MVCVCDLLSFSQLILNVLSVFTSLLASLFLVSLKLSAKLLSVHSSLYRTSSQQPYLATTNKPVAQNERGCWDGEQQDRNHSR